MPDYIVFYQDYADRVVSRAIFSAHNKEDAIEQAEKRQPDAEYWLRIETDDDTATISDFDIEALSDWIQGRKEVWEHLLSRRCDCCGSDFKGPKCLDCQEESDDDDHS